MTREGAIAVFECLATEMTAILAGIPKSEAEADQIKRYIDAYDMALSALRQQDVTDKDVGRNEPLTLDELRKMDGEPAWFVSLRDGFASWGIVRVVEMGKVWFIAVAGSERAFRAFGDLDGYGKTWLAYRQKPEEGTV